MNGYVLAGYLAVLGVLTGYAAFLVSRSRKMRKTLIPAKVEEPRDEPEPTE